MAVLLLLAAVGGAIRHWADNPSLLRDMGTLMLVLWLPAVGNLVAFVMRRVPRRAARVEGFRAGSVFLPHLRAELTPLARCSLQAWPTDGAACMLRLGQAGFTARLASPPSQWIAAGIEQTLELELLRPSLALPQLVPGTAFDLLVGGTLVGRGRVSQPPRA